VLETDRGRRPGRGWEFFGGAEGRLAEALVPRPQKHHPRPRGKHVRLLVHPRPTGPALPLRGRREFVGDVGLVRARAPQLGDEVGELGPQLHEADDARVSAIRGELRGLGRAAAEAHLHRGRDRADARVSHTTRVAS
jgi:hypothetical protein